MGLFRPAPPRIERHYGAAQARAEVAEAESVASERAAEQASDVVAQHQAAADKYLARERARDAALPRWV